MDDLLLSSSHSPPPSSPLHHKLQFLLQALPHSWLYAIFWQTSHDDRGRLRLSWAHGHFHGSIHRLESLLDDNLNDAEWFYVMSLTRTFSLAPDSSASSLPAKAFSSASPLWLNITQPDLPFPSCDRAREASLHGIRTLICVPTNHGVLEMGSSEIIPKSSAIIQQVKTLYSSSHFTPIVYPSNKQSEPVDFLEIGIIAASQEVQGEKVPYSYRCKSQQRSARQWKSVFEKEIHDALEVLQRVVRENDFVWHEKLKGMSGVKLTATIIKDGKNGGALSYAIELFGNEENREVMENSVINMKVVSRHSKLNVVPLIVGGNICGNL